MKAKRWTLGVVLAAAVSVFGLIKADASPFSTTILSDDLGNHVRGSAAEASEWENEAGGDSSGSGDSGGSVDSGGGDKDNAGHGNNEDGVDSSNRGQGQGGPSGDADASCPEGGECVDDEMSKGNNKK